MAFASALVISPVKLTSLNTEAMYADMDVNGIASKKTLQKAGLVPFAHILVGDIVVI
jgi:hypothetical protein